MSISIVNTIAILISDKRQDYAEQPFWKHFLTWTLPGETHTNGGQDEVLRPSTDTGEQDEASPAFADQDMIKSQETCAYCSFYEFGWCNFHDKSVASDAELCDEIQQMQ